MKPWYCMNCTGIVNLNRRGRCEVCDSDAVDVAVRPAMTPEGLAGNMTVAELEALLGEQP